MKTIILININEDPRKLVSKLVNILSYYNTEYCMRSEKLEVYLEDLLVKMRRVEVNSGIFVTNHNLSLPEYAHYLRTFATTNRVRFIIIK